MFWLSPLLGAAALIASAAAHPAASSPAGSYQVHEKREASHVQLSKRLESDIVLPIRIGLKQNAEALAKAEGWLRDVSHPESPNFAKHWTQEQVVEAFQPTNETLDTVTNWLVSSGIAKKRITQSDNKVWLAFDATTAEAEKLLKAEYYFHDEGQGKVLVGTNAYHLPAQVQEHVDYVTPGVKGTVISLEERRLKKKTTKRAVPPPVEEVEQGGQDQPETGLSASTSSKSRDSKLKLKTFPNVEGKSPDDLSVCDEVLTPACVRALYDFPAPEANAQVSPWNQLGIFEEGDYYDQFDLNTFYAKYASQVPNGTHPGLDSIDGGKAPVDNLQDDGGESLLDYSVAYPIIYPQKITLYQTDDEYNAASGQSNSTGLFNTFLDALDGSYCTYSAYGETGDAPEDPQYPDNQAPAEWDPYKGKLQCGIYQPTNIISISYGVYEQDLPYNYQERQCNEYLKLALQGVTILFASGDTGVGGYNYGTYGKQGYYGCLGDNDNVFTPSQACSCPWVTNVGATEVFPNKTVHDPEQAVLEMRDRLNGNYSSSGGFSNIFPTPWYQLEAVGEYYRVSNPPYPYYFNGDWKNAKNGGVYNRNGRGIPDVAANGDNYPVAQDGEFYLSGGTSQSAPLFASILNRIIEERIKIGKGRLGFINPTLYFHPEVLHDITTGVNPGCGTWGFSAAPGWDPVTGLGTPNYPKLLNLFLSLP